MCVCFIIAWGLDFGLPSAGQTLQDASGALSAASETLSRHPIGDDDLKYHRITHGNSLCFFQIFHGFCFLAVPHHFFKDYSPPLLL